MIANEMVERGEDEGRSDGWGRSDFPRETAVYQSDDGAIRLDVSSDGRTVWLTRAQMADLFGVKVPAISKHLKNIYEEGELEKESTLSKMETVQIEGDRRVTRQVEVLNLDAVISVGYRVNSRRATHFRKWATTLLKEYIVKGFALDDERLKGRGGGDYWNELLGRIRDIRSSEKVLYRQVLDLYATAVDYDPSAPETIKFFKIVQNKLHFGAHGHTAAEVIYDRAGAEKPFMGLTTFSGQQVTLADARIAKNYLNEDELKALGNLVSAFFDVAELRAQNHQATTMSDFLVQLDGLMTVAGRPILQNAGKVSHKQAMQKAENEYRKYQEHTLAPVEVAYLESIKNIAKDLPEKGAARGE